MRILFFSYLPIDGDKYMGGGWVNNLINMLHKQPHLEIGVVSMARVKTLKKRNSNGIIFYILPIKESYLKRMWRFISHKADITYDNNLVQSIVKDYSPDIIQLFGLETPFGSVLRGIIDIPVIVHIQGICTAYCDKWFPMGFSGRGVWWSASLKEKVTLSTQSDFYLRFVNLSFIEQKNYKLYRYYLGRTEWDYYISRLLSPSSQYYLCNEMLRIEFYGKKWTLNKETSKLIISTTMNGEIYKGFDTILRTATFLRRLGLNFEWNIYGVQESFSLRRVIEREIGLNFSDCNVCFRGEKNAKELVDALINTTFYIHASHIDNSPNALCEAMLLGVPCIATYVGGVPSLIEDKKTGYLVPDSEPYQLASLINLLYKSPLQLESISREARKIAIMRHDEKNILKQLIDAYQAVIKDFEK